MCGIFGFLASSEAGLSAQQRTSAFTDLFLLSASRGKEASGLALRTEKNILVCKLPLSPQRMTEQKQYRTTLEQAARTETFCAIGHSRLVTNGSKTRATNNQPVIKHGMVGIHNGIIVNADALWEKSDAPRAYDIDSEIILSLMDSYLTQGESLPDAMRHTLQQLKGSASVAMLFEEYSALALFTNTGSLYILQDEKRTFLAFASEEYILREWVRKDPSRNCPAIITHVQAGMHRLISLAGLECCAFGAETDAKPIKAVSRGRIHLIQNISPPSDGLLFKNALRDNPLTEIKIFEEQFQECAKRSLALRRCRRCILPESMPMIHFDSEGVCNYCRRYQPPSPEGIESLRNIFAPHRSHDGKPDCIVGFSGGRDSSYMLHVLKKDLGMNPIAYTYDWGMVTDLARRNQARMCGSLGIEHIVVSADIDFKRKNIRRNVSAWLHRPRLGMIPLFMAGDKQYFTHAYQLKKQTGIPLLLVGESPYEKTGFKTGFCGLKERDGQLSYSLTPMNKLRIIAYYGKEFLQNPRYLNASLRDTLSAFSAYYLLKHNYLNMYKYVPWDERIIEETLKFEYDWETATDTDSTWRIGDGTASFYNYIYFVMAGFSEHDTFRSNQLRADLISREEALASARKENQPRYDSIKWYCDTIGINMNDALRTIHAAPKVY